jgi:hypothetical protein
MLKMSVLSARVVVLPVAVFVIVAAVWSLFLHRKAASSLPRSKQEPPVSPALRSSKSVEKTRALESDKTFESIRRVESLLEDTYRADKSEAALRELERLFGARPIDQLIALLREDISPKSKARCVTLLSSLLNGIPALSDFYRIKELPYERPLPEPARSAILALVGDPRQAAYVRTTAMGTLYRNGPDADVREAFLRVLEEERDVDVLRGLLGAIYFIVNVSRDPPRVDDPEFRARYVQKALDLMDSDLPSDIRLSAIRMVTPSRDASLAPRLVERLAKEADPEVRVQLGEALESKTDERNGETIFLAVQALYFKENDVEVRKVMEHVLYSCFPDSAPASIMQERLTTAIRQAPDRGRQLALLIILYNSTTVDPAALVWLQSLANDESLASEVRAKAREFATRSADK